jgi:G3E family GTPase
VRGDLIRIIEGLMKRRGRFDGILIETTGLADPAPVAQTFFVDADVRRNTKLDAIVTVVDARHIGLELAEAHEAQEQIAFADIVLLNKTDLVEDADLTSIKKRLRSINPTVTIKDTRHCDVDLAAIMGRDAFSLDRILEIEPDFLNGALEHEHDEHVGSLSLSTDVPLDPRRVMNWVQGVVQTLGTDILRLKGILAFDGDPDRYVVQGVHMLVEGNHQRPWRTDEARTSRMVFIGRNLPRELLSAGFEGCRSGAVAG